MFRWLAVCLVLAAGVFGLCAVAAKNLGYDISGQMMAMVGPGDGDEEGGAVVTKPPVADNGKEAPQVEVARAPAPQADPVVDRGSDVREFAIPAGNALDRRQFLIVQDARVISTEKQEVPSEREGKLIFLGTEVDPQQPRPSEDKIIKYEVGFLAIEPAAGENVPEDQRVVFAGNSKVYRRCRPDDTLDPSRLVVARQVKEFR